MRFIFMFMSVFFFLSTFLSLLSLRNLKSHICDEGYKGLKCITAHIKALWIDVINSFYPFRWFVLVFLFFLAGRFSFFNWIKILNDLFHSQKERERARGRERKKMAKRKQSAFCFNDITYVRMCEKLIGDYIKMPLFFIFFSFMIQKVNSYMWMTYTHHSFYQWCN